ncbi:MAG: hypothetical protein HN696_02670 [Euryarchaeota archaeon]|nr:hypothetical protein [Euryarchaeota archaeon]
MDAPAWTVLRCSGCSQCFGRKAGAKGKCSRCGVIANEKTEIISHAANEQELQNEISLANVPEHLKSKLSEKMTSKTAAPVREDAAHRLTECLLSAAVDGIIKAENVVKSLAKMNITLRAPDLIEMAYSQGLLLKLSEDEWQVLD